MNDPRDSQRRKETILIYDMSPELEAELMRRAREKGTDASTEATEIIEGHILDENAGETD